MDKSTTEALGEFFPALHIAWGALQLSQDSLGANLVWKRCCQVVLCSPGSAS